MVFERVLSGGTARRHLSLAALGLALLCRAAAASAQAEPVIGHTPLECLLRDQFPELLAKIQPGAEIKTAKVYFRSDKYPDFYYVEMKVWKRDFLGILPKPGPETERIIYYVEAVDNFFNGARTEEYDPKIDEACRRRAPAAFLGDDPGIIVGATRAGMAAIPPGFQAAGIAGFISAAGVTSGVSGGLGLGTAVAVGAAAAGSAGAVIVASGGAASSTVPAALPPTTTSSTATTTAPTTTTVPSSTTSVRPTTTVSSTTSVPPTTSVSSTTTSPSTSTTTAISTTTTTAVSTTTTAVTSSTTSSVSSTTSSSTTTTVVAVNACFNANKQNSCVWEFSASCSSGPIVQYDWVVDAAGAMPAPRPPVNYSMPAPLLVVDWNPPYGGCSGAPTITVQLTVSDGGGGTSTIAQLFSIDLRGRMESAEIPTSFTSFLGIPPLDGLVPGEVRLGDVQLDTVANSGALQHRYVGRNGQNTVEAYLTGGPGPGGFWRFDFSAAEHYVSGSLSVESGPVLSLDAHSVVFQVGGAAGERLRFSYRLSH